jgi:hypothetical protein
VTRKRHVVAAKAKARPTQTRAAAKPVAIVVRPPKPFADLCHPNARAQRAFLIAYAKTGIITRAAAAARVDRHSHLNWLAYDGRGGEAYRLAFSEAEEMAADVLEAEARRRAVEGLVRYRFDKQGNPLLHPLTKKPYYELEYSDALLQQQLRANRPEKYRERLEHTGKDGGPILIEPVVEKLRARLEAQASSTREPSK